MSEGKRMKRIYNEWKELENSKEILESSGIYFSLNEEKPNLVRSLLIGPKDTPYENGYYLFEFEYPTSYPMQPPIAKFCTSGAFVNDINHNAQHSKNLTYVRFNPNLYTNGKVCLSMLNTWSGPGWVPTNTICNVLVAIQALVLNENPLVNEPGFESAERSSIESYNDFLSFANIQFAIYEMIKKCNTDFTDFLPVMKTLFLKNYESIIKRVDEQTHKYGLKPFLLSTSMWNLSTIVCYNDIKKNVKDLYESITSENKI